MRPLPGEAMSAPVALILRHNLFRRSEPFITQQAGAFARYRPLYLGRLRYGPAPGEALALEDLAPRFKYGLAAWQMLSRDVGPYMRLLAGRRVAVVHAHFGIEGAYALPLAARLNAPLVTTFHGFDATLGTAGLLSSPAWAAYPFLRGRLARRGDLFLCVSDFIRGKLLAQGFPAEKTRVHYIGVDTARLTPRAAGGDEGFVLHVARLVEVKGTEYLLRAVAKMARPPRLVMIGEGPLRARLAALAGELGVRAEFLGAMAHEEVLGWMRRAGVLVLPSVRTRSGREEGLGMVTLEAAALGVPVIGADVGGIGEAVADGVSGFLVPSRDPEALAARLELVLGDAALRARLGAGGRARVVAGFDLARQSAALEAMYDELRAARAR
ncbi:glycosyltransferase [Acidocella sp.]|uniref:glycosyltransferase n=2 Tax=Acidocella sp. TaxID=50710 RepID=UPI00262D17DC|nr:glycosyltransferase [Acidocella sp.]